MREKYKDECKQIQQNCTYTAEAHYHLAIWNRVVAYLFQIVPAAVAAITGILVAANAEPTSWLWVTVIASVISVVAGILEPNKKYQEHLNAGRQFTALKHDARFLHEAKGDQMTDEAFCVAVENLHDKYNELLKNVPPTGNLSFEKARKVVGRGIHEPDKDAHGKIR
jgi:hypothetical protein